MDCKECKEGKKVQTIPYVVHESAMARAERHIKRLWIALIVAIILLFASVVVNYLNNKDWLNYINEYDFASTTTSIDASQDGEGVNIVGGGDIDYGAESQDNN